jgi:hypothetical protein
MWFESNNSFETKSLRELEIEKINAETKQNKEKLKNSISQSIINKLLSEEWYTVRSNDILSLINKITVEDNHINFRNEWDNIWPGDKIRIIDKKVFRTHNWIDEIVWIVTKGFKKTNIEKTDETSTVKKKEEKQQTKDKDQSPTQAQAKDNQENNQDTTAELNKQKETIESVSTYFSVDLTKLNNQLEKNHLNLDLVSFLSWYKNYIEENLSTFEYKEKIIDSISKKIGQLSEIVQERIDWVDEQIEENDYKKEDRVKEIQNQRWIINSKIQELFSDINNKVLPWASLLLKNQSIPNDSKKIKHESLEEIQTMFEAKILDDWDFDKTFWSWELIDANTNNWNTLDSSNPEDKEFFDKNWIKTLSEVPSLLEWNDKKIEENATIAYFSYIFISMVPYVWAAASVPSDMIDLFSDEEWVIKILRGMWIIDENFRMEKSMLDNILGWLWLALTIFWLQSISKWWKIIKNWSKLDKIWAWKIEQWLVVMGKKLWLTEEKINKVLDLFRKSKNETKWWTEIIEWSSSTPINFYKNKITWETYTKTLDWTFLNDKWEIVYKEWVDFIWNKKIDKDFLSKIEKNTKKQEYKWSTEAPIDKNAKTINTDWTNPNFSKKNKKTKTDSWTNKTETLNDSAELNSKKINSLFEKQFKKKMNDEWKITIEWKNITKRKDWKYEISWDANIYSKKQILEKIPLNEKKQVLEKAAKEKIKWLAPEKIIKIKDWAFTFKNKYKVSKDEIIIKEKGIERKLTKEEEVQFYKDNYQEILSKMWFNLKKDSEVLVEKIKGQLKWNKWTKMIKSINDFLESIPALWKIYKWWKWLWKQAIDSILTPYNIIKNIKKADWFQETLKSVIFANKDIGYIKWTWKVAWTLAIPTIWEIIYEANTNPEGDMKLSWWNIAANYAELMYLGVINTLIIETLNIDETILNEKP